MGNAPNPSLVSLMESKPDQPTIVQRIKNSLFERAMTVANAKFGELSKVAVATIGGWLTTTALASFSAYAAKNGLELSPEQVNTAYNFIHALEEMVMVLMYFGYNLLVQMAERKSKVTLQIKLGTKPDGWIGPQTIRRAEIVVSNATSDTSKL